VLVDEARQVECEMLAHVTYVVDDDVTAFEAPIVTGAHEVVAVPAADDRLERQHSRLLEHDEHRAGRRVPGDLVWGATARVLTELLCLVSGVDWPGAYRVWG